MFSSTDQYFLVVTKMDLAVVSHQVSHIYVSFIYVIFVMGTMTQSTLLTWNDNYISCLICLLPVLSWIWGCQHWFVFLLQIFIMKQQCSNIYMIWDRVEDMRKVMGSLRSCSTWSWRRRRWLGWAWGRPFWMILGMKLMAVLKGHWRIATVQPLLGW